VTETRLPSKHPWHVGRLVTAWLIATVFGVLIAVLTEGETRFQWLALAAGLSVLVTFALQIGTAQREGFITRTSFSVAGSIVIIAVIDIIFVLILG
jgi:hypothetical protein